VSFRDARLRGLLAGNFVVALSFYTVVGLLDQIASALGVSIGRAGLLVSAFALASVVGAPLLATLTSAMDRRRLLVGTLLFCAVANAAACFVTDFGDLLLIRIASAAASAIFTPQAAAVVGGMVPGAQRNSSMSFIMLGWGIAGVLGLPLGVLVGAYLGWQATFAVNAIGCILVVPLLWRDLPAGLHVPTLNLDRWLAVLRHPVLPLLIASSLAMSVANQMVFSYLAPLCRQVLGLSGEALSLLFLVHGLASVAANIVAVNLLQRIDPGRLATGWAGCATAGLLLWPAVMLSAPLVFPLQFLWSLGIAGYPTAQQTRLASAAPALIGGSIALNSSAGYLGQAIGASFGGAVWMSLGPQYLSVTALLPAALGVVLGWFALRRAAGFNNDPAAVQ